MGEKKDAMILKEILKKMNRLKSSCSAKSSIYTLLLLHCLSLLFCHGHACPPNPFSESMHETNETNKANAISEINNPSPTETKGGV